MTSMGSGGQTGGGGASQILVFGGVLLLVAGGMLAYPYVSSRLAGISPAPTLAPTFSPPHTPTPSLSHTPTPSLPHISTPTPPHTPTLTPTPALPTHIAIPVIGVDAPVVPVSWSAADVGDQMQAAWDVPDEYAAGWHETSAPLGVPGNTVLNGHNTANGEIFRDLYALEAGDVITVSSGDVAYTYAVSETLILPEAGQPLEVRLENARYILPTDDERLTLVTCHPYGSLRYRLIVIARPSGE